MFGKRDIARIEREFLEVLAFQCAVRECDLAPQAEAVRNAIAPEGVLAGAEGAFAPATVNPGDLVVADEDGVVFVTPDLVADVVRLAEKGREVDAKCMADIQAGVGVQEAFKRHRGK